ncbi:spidroin-1-like [Zingiber officinale]|uniref:spidroin-1-like n=1 Tax=Zingiber officinale TaxID=94328 RepID=UPI001C4C1BD7|nr:spidroin-1-like [Zingiber officinale]
MPDNINNIRPRWSDDYRSSSILRAEPFDRAIARFWAVYIDDKVGEGGGRAIPEGAGVAGRALRGVRQREGLFRRGRRRLPRHRAGELAGVDQGAGEGQKHQDFGCGGASSVGGMGEAVPGGGVSEGAGAGGRRVSEVIRSRCGESVKGLCINSVRS